MEPTIRSTVVRYSLAVVLTVFLLPLLGTTRENVGGINGKLFHDLNYNGVFDTGEPPLDFAVVLSGQVNTTIIPDVNGFYSFNNLPYGEYQVAIVIPNSWTILNVNYTGKKYLNINQSGIIANEDFAVFNLVRPSDGPEQLFINGFNTGLANNVRPGSPDAPQQSPPMSPESRLFHSTYLTASSNGFVPDTLYIHQNQIVPMCMESLDMTHVFLFDDPGLSAIAIGIGPLETRALYWKAYNVVPGQTYRFRCDVPGHSSRGEVGFFHILSAEYPDIVLLNPMADDTLIIGQNYTANWTSSGTGFVLVQLSTNNGQTWFSLNSASLGSEQQSFTFNVPDIISNQCKMRIIDVDYIHEYYVSPGTFSIQPASWNPAIVANTQHAHFENVILTNTTPSIAIQISNVGYNDLSISNWMIQDHPEWYNVTMSEDNPVLGHLDSVNLSITCTPAVAGAYQDVLYIYSNASLTPVLAITLSGMCEYIPPAAPQNVQSVIDSADLLLSWDPVTQDIYGNPTSISYYFVYGSNVPNPSLENLVFLGYSVNNSFRHLGINLQGTTVLAPRQMFYKVTGVLWIPSNLKQSDLDRMAGKVSMSYLTSQLRMAQQ